MTLNFKYLSAYCLYLIFFQNRCYPRTHYKLLGYNLLAFHTHHSVNGFVSFSAFTLWGQFRKSSSKMTVVSFVTQMPIPPTQNIATFVLLLHGLAIPFVSIPPDHGIGGPFCPVLGEAQLEKWQPWLFY